MKEPVNFFSSYKFVDYPTEAHALAAAFTQLATWIDENSPTSWGFIYTPQYNDEGTKTGDIGIEIWVQNAANRV
jgi:hypothetical protein